MQRFFLSAQNIDGDIINIIDSDAKHISKVLRMNAGDNLIVCDMQHTEYFCEIISLTYDTVRVKILSKAENDTEPYYRAYLYQALPKGDKMDYIVQKAVELGVYEIIPFISERCISRPDGNNCAKKTARWQRISEAAAKQCGRGIVPKIGNVIGYEQALYESSSGDLVFLCYEGDDTIPIRNVIADESVDVRFIIGAEGGFAVDEVELAEKKGIRAVGLGKRILRCETASGFVLSCLAYEKEH